MGPQGAKSAVFSSAAFSTLPRVLGWLVALVMVTALGLRFWGDDQRHREQLAAVEESHDVHDAIHETLSLMKDVETGQRGFVVTGNEDFLLFYHKGRAELPRQFALLQRLVQQDPHQLESVEEMKHLTRDKLGEMEKTVQLRRAGSVEEAAAMISAGKGRRLMLALRAEAARMSERERARLDLRIRQASEHRRESLLVLGGAWSLVGLLVLVGLLASARGLRDARAANVRLEESEKTLQKQADSATDLVRILDENAKPLYVSPSCERLLGYTQARMLQLGPQDLLVGEEMHEALEIGRRIRDGQSETAVFVHRLRHASGELRWFETTVGVVEGTSRQHIHLTSRDIHERRQAEHALASFTIELEESEARMRVLSNASFEGVVISQDGTIVDVNETFAQWMGCDSADLIGLDGRTLFVPEDLPSIERQIAQGDHYQARLQPKHAAPLPVEVRGRETALHGRNVRIAVLRDITERLAREAENAAHAEELRKLSLRDELTGLYNRRGFLEHAGQMLKQVARQRRHAAVFFADLNGLKLVNDSLGHEVGDRMIRATATVLNQVFRDADVVARLGGDEFAIFAPECSPEDAGKIRARLDAALDGANASSPDSSDYDLSMSVGCAFQEPGQPVDLAALMDAADRKMYEEKRQRGGRSRTEPGRPNVG
ncbi:MAG TPA: diguanylate cyclase [Polyangiaceae bacterium]|nr:diguanylate cyclase [Polyangiaceae bacterium]